MTQQSLRLETHLRSVPAHPPPAPDHIGERLLNEARKHFAAFSTMHPMGADFDPDAGRAREEYRYPLASDFPEHGTNAADLLTRVFDALVPGVQKPGHPRYFAYLAGSADPLAAWAQAAALLINPYAAHHALAPACVDMEREVIGWFRELFGFPHGGSGLLTTGSSLALLSAIHAARHSRLHAGEDARARIYLSEQGHHAVEKAAALAGFRADAVVRIPCTELHVNVEILAARIAADRQNGLRPFLMVGTAGTTCTGSVDPLDELAALAARHNLWFHVDGAYGAPFFLTEFGRAALRGMELADSLNFDFHKSLSMPYGTGCLLVRDASTLRFPDWTHASYMPPSPAAADPADLGPELSRDFRALRVWLPLRAHGFGHYRAQLASKRRQALALHARLERLSRLTVLAPALTVVAFHCGARTRALLADINRRGRVFLSGCRIHGQDFIRVCVLSYLTQDEDVEACAEEIQAALLESRP